MSCIVRPSQSQQKVVAQDQATLDRALQRSIIRRTSVAGLIGLVYGLCAGIILAAYDDFGSFSLLEPSRLMVADPTQVKPLPKESMLEDAAVAHELATQLAPAAALADTGPVALPIGHIRPAMAPWSVAEMGGVGMPPATEGRDSTRDTASPDPSGYELRAEERPGAAAPQPAHPGTTVAMPKPAFKPLDAITTLVAEAAEPAALGAPEASGGAVSRSRPARPPLKPVVVASKPRPLFVRQPDARAMARPAQNLPEALRSMWTDLKILLASAPARSEFRGDRGGNGGGERSAIDSGRRTGSDSASTPSGSDSASTPSGSGGGGNPSGSDGGNPSGSGGGSGGGSSPGGSGGGGAAPAVAAAAATRAVAVAAAAQAAAAAGAAQAAAMVVVAQAAAAAVPAPVAAMTAAAPAAAATAVAAEVMAAGVAAVVATGTMIAAAGAMIAAAEGMATAAAGGMTEAMTMTTEASAAPESTILRSQAGTGPRRRPEAGRSDRRSVCRPCAGRRRRETG